jgi:nitrate reductase NapE component
LTLDMPCDKLRAMEQKTGFKELILRLVAIVGLIAVLILGAWGIILLAFNLVGIFSGAVTLDSIFGDRNTPPQQQIATTTPTPTVTVNNNTNTTANTPSNTTANNVNTTPKPTTVVPSSQQNAVYTAAPRPAQMY